MQKYIHLLNIVLFLAIIATVLFIIHGITEQEPELDFIGVHACEKYEDQAQKEDCYLADVNIKPKPETCEKITDRRKKLLCERTVYKLIKEFEDAKAEFESRSQ